MGWLIGNLGKFTGILGRMGINKIFTMGVNNLGIIAIIAGAFFGLDKDTTQQLAFAMSKLTLSEFIELIIMVSLLWMYYLIIKSVFVIPADGENHTLFTLWLKKKLGL